MHYRPRDCHTTVSRGRVTCHRTGRRGVIRRYGLPDSPNSGVEWFETASRVFLIVIVAGRCDVVNGPRLGVPPAVPAAQARSSRQRTRVSEPTRIDVSRSRLRKASVLRFSTRVTVLPPVSESRPVVGSSNSVGRRGGARCPRDRGMTPCEGRGDVNVFERLRQ